VVRSCDLGSQAASNASIAASTLAVAVSAGASMSVTPAFSLQPPPLSNVVRRRLAAGGRDELAAGGPAGDGGHHRRPDRLGARAHRAPGRSAHACARRHRCSAVHHRRGVRLRPDPGQRHVARRRPGGHRDRLPRRRHDHPQPGQGQGPDHGGDAVAGRRHRCRRRRRAGVAEHRRAGHHHAGAGRLPRLRPAAAPGPRATQAAAPRRPVARPRTSSRTSRPAAGTCARRSTTISTT